MIIHLKGGLGNQLFQLSFAHLIFERTSRRQFVFLPRIYRSNSDVREFLSKCNHVREVPTLAGYVLELIFKFRWLQGGLSRLGILFLEGDMFDEILSSKVLSKAFWHRFTLISGFWQDWKLAITSEEVFASELQTFLDTQVNAPAGLELRDRIVVHVRRGDLLLQHNREVYGIVPISSYQKILQNCKTKFPRYTVTTVSDSPDHVLAEGIDFEFGSLLGPELCDPWQVLKIMRNANIVISANSTLSWWGAFIAVRCGASAFVPTPWYANYSAEESAKKMFPEFNFFDADYESKKLY